MACKARRTIAAKHGLAVEDPAVMCALVCCCSCCVMAQELREVAHASAGASKDMNCERGIAAPQMRAFPITNG